MGKFLLGLLTGAILVVLIGVIGFFAVASLRSRPPAVAQDSTLILHLWGDVPEKPPVEFQIPGVVSRNSITVENVWSMLRRAAQDNRIKAVIFEPEGASVGWATMQEIHGDLEAFRKSGKPIYAYLQSPSLRDYYMATAASRIYMPPSDLLNLKGIAFQLMYFKNTLDKLGVQVDVQHAGAYKDYGDQFTRASMSPETKEVMNSLADGLYGDLLNVIAKGRNKSVDAVRALIDQGPFLATQAKADGLVDELRYEDQVFGEMKTALHESELKKISEKEYADVSDASAGMAAQDQVAFVVAEGTIERGDDSDGLQSGDFDRMLQSVGSDSRVKAAIIRINSPGGEVVASDDMWRALNELKKKKPLVISMADEAASGGYYMAMTGSPIVAEPGTLTGSIGVVFGKPDLHGLYDKLGITKDFVSRGKFALIDSDYSSLNPDEQAKLKEGIDATYQDFLDKVSKSRNRPVSAIEPVAQGRVWLGDQARDKGLVDSMGGIDAAIARARQLAGISSSSRVGLVLYPAKKSLFEYITEAFGAGGSGDEMDTILRRVIKDPRLRVWAHPGMMRMMPFSVEFQ
ncbi:MAG TPA: signal peptide peptidase SppA [Bryobacteraceae bacterium]|nr:signal peptide peptidase SppA [Bryobacteraceae bacterium]